MAQACGQAALALAKTSEGKAAEVERLIAPAVNALGYAIVRVLLSGKQNARLQIMAERLDGAGMRVEDCTALSRTASAILDVEDPISGTYELEVSSPGIDRPLTRLADFERFAGFDAKVEIAVPVEGKRRWTGRLLGVDGEAVRMTTETGEIAVAFSDLVRAKLLMTDELLAAAQGARDSSNQGTE